MIPQAKYLIQLYWASQGASTVINTTPSYNNKSDEVIGIEDEFELDIQS